MRPTVVQQHWNSTIAFSTHNVYFLWKKNSFISSLHLSATSAALFWLQLCTTSYTSVCSSSINAHGLCFSWPDPIFSYYYRFSDHSCWTLQCNRTTCVQVWINPCCSEGLKFIPKLHRAILSALDRIIPNESLPGALITSDKSVLVVVF